MGGEITLGRLPVSASDEPQPATQRQLRYLQAVAREAGYDGAALDNRSQQEFGCKAAALSRRQASQMIDVIQTEHQMWKGVR